MKFPLCAFVALFSSSTTAFQIGAFQTSLRPRTAELAPSTRRWTLKEPTDAASEVESLSEDNKLVSKKQKKKEQARREREEAEAADVAPAESEQEEQVVMQQQQQQQQEEEREVVADFSPSENEEELSRDEHFMRMAIELAEEEYVGNPRSPPHPRVCLAFSRQFSRQNSHS